MRGLLDSRSLGLLPFNAEGRGSNEQISKGLQRLLNRALKCKWASSLGSRLCCFFFLHADIETRDTGNMFIWARISVRMMANKDIFLHKAKVLNWIICQLSYLCVCGAISTV